MAWTRLNWKKPTSPQFSAPMMATTRRVLVIAPPELPWRFVFVGTVGMTWFLAAHMPHRSHDAWSRHAARGCMIARLAGLLAIDSLSIGRAPCRQCGPAPAAFWRYTRKFPVRLRGAEVTGRLSPWRG